jgi:hypothetical protein
LARLIGNEQARRSVASSDRMMREARGDLALAFDDKSYPEQPHCIPPNASVIAAHARHIDS